MINLPNKLFEELKKYIIKRSSKSKHIRYAGGDWPIKDDLLKIALKVPLKKATFVEVFGGSGVMSQIIPRDRFPNVIYNDIDRDLVALHMTIKNNPDLLASILSLLPYSRYLHGYMTKNLIGRELGEIIGATVLFYILSTSFSGEIGSTFSTTKESRSSAAVRFVSHIAAIYDTARKFKDVVIEQLDFEELIKKYDSENTLFYLDPPYLDTERGESDYYRHGFTLKDVNRLSSILKNVKGYFMIKINEDNETFYKSIPVIDRVEIKIKLSMDFVDGEKRREYKYLVLTNYRVHMTHTQTLFVRFNQPTS